MHKKYIELRYKNIKKEKLCRYASGKTRILLTTLVLMKSSLCPAANAYLSLPKTTKI